MAKIVFLVSSLGGGGAERVASTLCNAWAARGDRVTLIPTFSGGGTAFYPLDKRIELVYLACVVSGNGKTPIGYVKRLLALRQLIHSREADVVISFLSNVNVAAILAVCGLKVPLIICERTDPMAMPMPQSLLFATKLLYRFADVLVVQTQALAVKIIHFFPGVKCISAIANPVPETLLSLPRKECSSERKILLSLGRIVDEKQVHLIIEVFLKLHDQFSEWDLHIYGEGPARPRLEKQVQESGIINRIFLKGSTSEPSRVMANADVFVMASKYEGFPNALLEAMAIGLPCVSFDCPSGPREMSADGKYALLVPAGSVEGLESALGKLFGSDALRSELGQNARHSIQQRYTLTAVLAQWDTLFHEVAVVRERG
jgi:GalNAc-alpha-(1->4)-GalNAc-alpha-(1->3)-diNAcBac-PP-undecaprenol alpha-1,4-N-acetyl-D-galactosaminyltransferase